MPNWCYNHLQVSGKKEILADFTSKTIVHAKEDDEYVMKFTFNILHPTPKALEGECSPLRKLEGEDDTQYKERMAENVRLYGAEDWYRWHLDNWGTKWDSAHTYIDTMEDEELIVNFDTAWSPPIDFFHKIFPMYPELRFEWIIGEESQQYCGKIIAEGGEIVFDESGEYIYQDEDGKPVIYDPTKRCWKYEKSGELIEDDDFYPIDINPYEFN